MPARVAPITRSAGSRARGASRRQRYTTTSTATNDTALSANTSAGPDAATSTPPRAGPTARPMFTGNALSVTARVSSDAGTSADVLHPRPDVGHERSDPQRAEYRMRQGSPGRLGGAVITTQISTRH